RSRPSDCAANRASSTSSRSMPPARWPRTIIGFTALRAPSSSNDARRRRRLGGHVDQALLTLYHRHVAVAFDRQMRLADFLDRYEASGKPYVYTISTATLEFGDAVRFTALDLGSHADPDNSWLWAWCNPHLKLTTANRKLGKAVRDLGADAGI